MNSVKKLEGSKFEVTIVKSGAEVVSMREHVLTHFKAAKVDGIQPRESTYGYNRKNLQSTNR